MASAAPSLRMSGRVAGQADDRPGAKHFLYGVRHGNARLFVDHAEHFFERAAERVALGPARHRFRHRIHEGDVRVGVRGDHAIADAGERDAELLPLLPQLFGFALERILGGYQALFFCVVGNHRCAPSAADSGRGFRSALGRPRPSRSGAKRTRASGATVSAGHEADQHLGARSADSRAARRASRARTRARSHRTGRRA